MMAMDALQRRGFSASPTSATPPATRPPPRSTVPPGCCSRSRASTATSAPARGWRRRSSSTRRAAWSRRSGRSRSRVPRRDAAGRQRRGEGDRDPHRVHRSTSACRSSATGRTPRSTTVPSGLRRAGRTAVRSCEAAAFARDRRPPSGRTASPRPRVRSRYDHAVCAACESKICVTACVPQILKLDDDGLPVLNVTRPRRRKGRCIECLACEVDCCCARRRRRARQPADPGLDEYRRSSGNGVEPWRSWSTRRTRVLVQGITGREGRARARLMRELRHRGRGRLHAGARRRGGRRHPRLRHRAEAVEKPRAASTPRVIFVPAPLVKDAALEAIAPASRWWCWWATACRSGTCWRWRARPSWRGVDFLGPNTLGVLSVGKRRARDDRRSRRPPRGRGSSGAPSVSRRAPAA